MPGSAYAQDSVAAARVESYQLGGSTVAAAHSPATTAVEEPARINSTFLFPTPLPPALYDESWGQTRLGQIAVYGAEEHPGDEEVLRLGTTLTRGRATTGLTIAYQDSTDASQSELFVDYALTQNFSVGVSGIVSDNGGADDDMIGRLGVSAAYSGTPGTFVRGGIADAPDESPVFGLSFGLSF